MRHAGFALMIAALIALTACGGGRDPKFKYYSGPEVTGIFVDKSDRVMYLMHGRKVLKQFPIGLGFAPVGHKQFEGDGRTPEGTYYIDRRNPNSDFHLSLGISYPNVFDAAYARTAGRSPGGDIFIHGEPNKKAGRGGPEKGFGPDWTAGCISLSNRHVEEAYAMIRDGTPITIRP